MNACRYSVASGPWSDHTRQCICSEIQAISRTEGYLGEEMMDHMEVRHIVEEETTHPSQEVTVDSGSGASLEIPQSVPIVRELWICVM